MSKSNIDENILFNDLNNNSQVKKLRFHPYYYQGRKGSYYNSLGKRVNVKVVKIEKSEIELVLTITGNLENHKLKLRSSWTDLEFDYYSIRCMQDWKIKFTKK